MPGARTHDIITVATGVALAPLAYATNIALGEGAESAARLAAVFVGAHVLSGIMFSPDLDLDSAIDNRWGVFYWIWRPYMWVVPHRSLWFSHGLIVPPLLRLLYFYWVVIGLLIGGAWVLGHAGVAVPDLASRVGDVVLGVVVRYPRATWAFILGFIAGSAAHSVADWTVTGGKRYLRQFGFRVTRDYREHDHYQASYRRRARY